MVGDIESRLNQCKNLDQFTKFLDELEGKKPVKKESFLEKMKGSQKATFSTSQGHDYKLTKDDLDKIKLRLANLGQALLPNDAKFEEAHIRLSKLTEKTDTSTDLYEKSIEAPKSSPPPPPKPPTKMKPKLSESLNETEEQIKLRELLKSATHQEHYSIGTDEPIEVKATIQIPKESKNLTFEFDEENDMLGILLPFDSKDVTLSILDDHLLVTCQKGRDAHLALIDLNEYDIDPKEVIDNIGRVKNVMGTVIIPLS